MAQANTSENSKTELSASEQTLANKLGNRSTALFLVGLIAFLELLIIFQLSHPGGLFG